MLKGTLCTSKITTVTVFVSLCSSKKWIAKQPIIMPRYVLFELVCTRPSVSVLLVSQLRDADVMNCVCSSPMPSLLGHYMAFGCMSLQCY